MEQIDYDVDDFMNYCDVKNLSTRTISSYEQTLRLFAQYLKIFFPENRQEYKKEIRTTINNYIRNMAKELE